MKNRIRAFSGFTLMELLVTLTILSILASAALPYVEVVVTRTKELELHSTLREIRIAIDNFHEDWQNGKISKTNRNASEDGYPITLQILVEGIESSDVKGGKRRYLRRIPNDPFFAADKRPEDNWILRGYQDDIDATIWSGKDVYDIHSGSDKLALDGSHYHDW
jgi:general secretion pathway protein G